MYTGLVTYPFFLPDLDDSRIFLTDLNDSWIFLPDLDDSWIFLTDFRNILKYEISRNSVYWEPRFSIRTDGRTNITNLIVAFRNFANAPKNVPEIRHAAVAWTKAAPVNFQRWVLVDTVMDILNWRIPLLI